MDFFRGENLKGIVRSMENGVVFIELENGDTIHWPSEQITQREVGEEIWVFLGTQEKIAKAVLNHILKTE